MNKRVGFFKQTIRDLPLDGDTVLVRADYNVPLDSNGEISDDLRICSNIPTLEYLLDRGCKVVIISHLGRPNGREEKYSLAQVADRLSELLDRDVTFIDDCIGEKVYQGVRKAPAGSVILLENLRYYEEEEANDHEFAKNIAKCSHAKYFVEDGFGVVHRAHASTHAITLCLPSVAGLLLEREYKAITESMQNPKRPLVAILGGAKVDDKIGIIEQFVETADQILIGGAMANTFLHYKGYNLGNSKVETDKKEILDKIYEAARKKLGTDNTDQFIVLPIDLAVAKKVDVSEKRVIKSLREMEAYDMALDIGDVSIERFTKIVSDAKTVIWNGPVGMGELPEFAHGSARLCLALATNSDIDSVIGGGDTADFVLKWDGQGGKGFSHISTGGGASLDLMAGKKLPGVESLLDSKS